MDAYSISHNFASLDFPFENDQVFVDMMERDFLPAYRARMKKSSTVPGFLSRIRDKDFHGEHNWGTLATIISGVGYLSGQNFSKEFLYCVKRRFQNPA